MENLWRSLKIAVYNKKECANRSGEILVALHAGSTMHCFGGAQQHECMPTMYHFPLTSQVYTVWCWFLTEISNKSHFSLWFLMWQNVKWLQRCECFYKAMWFCLMEKKKKSVSINVQSHRSDKMQWMWRWNISRLSVEIISESSGGSHSCFSRPGCFRRFLPASQIPPSAACRCTIIPAKR